jgi:hypothetical protein
MALQPATRGERGTYRYRLSSTAATNSRTVDFDRRDSPFPPSSCSTPPVFDALYRIQPQIEFEIVSGRID